MTNLPSKPSRIDFDKIDVYEIQKILSTGDLSALSAAEKEYFSLMELVRGLRARMLLPGGRRIVTKAGIIKLLKSEPYGLTDWMARQVYSDAINFFYTEDNVSTRAWLNLYAEKLEKVADLAVANGKLKEAKSYYELAAKLRGCFDAAAPEIPEELLNARPIIIYTGDAESLGAPKADRREVEEFIDGIPDLAFIDRQRLKEDAGVSKRNLINRLISDVKEFGEDSD